MINTTATGDPDTITVTIPCLAEYVSVARLVILGAAAQTRFSFNEVEDIRAAVGEACACAIDRASRHGVNDAVIRLDCRISPDEMSVEVRDTVMVPSSTGSGQSPETFESPSVSLMLMRALVDTVEVFGDTTQGYSVRMVKHARKPVPATC